MTRSRTVMALAAATVGLTLAYAPAALADDTSHGNAMTKTDHMGTTKGDGMKKDTMSGDHMSNGATTKDDMKK